MFLIDYLYPMSENPNLRLRSRLELWSRSRHGWFLQKSFLTESLHVQAALDFSMIQSIHGIKYLYQIVWAWNISNKLE